MVITVAFIDKYLSRVTIITKALEAAVSVFFFNISIHNK